MNSISGPASHQIAADITRYASSNAKIAAKLSSGLRLTAAADDAAGVSMASKLTANVKGLTQALRNVSEASALLSTADRGIGEGLKMLQRIRELAVQASSDTNSDFNRQALNLEAKGIEAEYISSAENLNHNTIKLVDGSFKNRQFQIGADSSQIMLSSIEDIRLQNTKTYQALSDATLSIGGADTQIGAGTVSIESLGQTDSVTVTSGMSAGEVAELLSAQSDRLTFTAETRMGISQVSTDAEYSFRLNGIAVSVDITNPSDLSGLRSSINAVSETTGVTAEMGASGELVLLSETGADIALTDFAANQNNASFRITSLGLDGVQSGATQDLNWTTLQAGYTETITDTEVTLSGFSFLANVSLNINGLNVGPVLITDPTNTSVLRTAINTISGLTGVQAVSGGAAGEIVLSSTAVNGAVNVAILGGAITQTTNTTTTTTQFSANTAVHVTGQIEAKGDDQFTLSHSLSGGGLGFVASPQIADIDEVIGKIDLTTSEAAAATIEWLDANIDRITSIRGDIGAQQNRLDHAIESISRTERNTSASLSHIQDADIASLTTQSAKTRLLYQAATGLFSKMMQHERDQLSRILA